MRSSGADLPGAELTTPPDEASAATEQSQSQKLGGLFYDSGIEMPFWVSLLVLIGAVIVWLISEIWPF